MTARITIDGNTHEIDGTIESFMLSMGLNPDSFLYLSDGTPIPMDTTPADGQTIKAIRVASGG